MSLNHLNAASQYNSFIPVKTLALEVTGQLKYDINPVSGYVLTSDSAGNASWQPTGGSSGSVDAIKGDGNVLVNGTSGSYQTGNIALTTAQNITTSASVEFAKLGIGYTAPTGSISLAVNGDTFLDGEIYPASDNTFDCGTQADKWAQVNTHTIRIADGATTNYILASLDSTGLATWINPSTIAGNITSIQGTLNEVLVNGTYGSPQTGVITLTTPQAIATTSSPTFNNLLLANGILSTPSYGFTNSTNSGLYLSGTNQVSLASNGIEAIRADSSGNITIQNNLTVNGTSTTVNSTVVSVADNIITIGAGNPADSLDLGVAFQYTNSGTKYGAFYRLAGTDTWTIKDSITTPPGNTITGGITANLLMNTVTTAGLKLTTSPVVGYVATCSNIDGTMSWSNASTGFVTSLTSASPNQITLSASTGNITIGTPQDINTISSPTFASLTLGSPTAASTLLVLDSLVASTSGIIFSAGGTQQWDIFKPSSSSNLLIYAETTSGVAASFNQNLGVSIGSNTTPIAQGLNIASLTASQAVVTDASKNLISLAYAANGGTSNIASRDSNGVINSANFVSSLTQVTSANTTTTLTASSTKQQVLIGTNAQTFQLPNATTLYNGTQFEFYNDSTGLLTIKDNSGTTLTTLIDGGANRLVLISNATSAGSWDYRGYIPLGCTWGTNQLSNFNNIVTPAINISTSPTSGYVLTSDSSGNGTWQPTGAITSIVGTANEIIVTPSGSTVTLSTPQPIATTSTPTFSTLTLNGSTTETLYVAAGLVENILVTGYYSPVMSAFQSYKGIYNNVEFSPSLSSTDWTSNFTGEYLNPQFLIPFGKTSTGNCTALYVSPVVNANIGVLTNLYGIYYDGGTTGAGTITNSYGLYVANPNAGSNKICAYFGGSVGIGTNPVTSPIAYSLTTSGSIAMGASTTAYNELRVGGGDSYGYVYGDVTYVDNINIGYNYSVKSGIFSGSSLTSRLACGFGTFGFYVGAAGVAPTTNMMFINSSGVGIGNTSPSYSLDVSGSTQIGSRFSSSGSTVYYNMQLTGTITNNDTTSSTGTQVGLQNAQTFAPTLGANNCYGQYMENSFQIPTSKTVANAITYYSYPLYNNSNNLGTISNAYNMFLDSGSAKYSSATITSAYTLYCNAPTCASNNYCAVFYGNVGYNTTTPAYTIDCTGSERITGYLYVGSNSNPSLATTYIEAGTNRGALNCSGRGTYASTSDMYGIYVDTAFAPSQSITNVASITVYPNFQPYSPANITNAYGMYIEGGNEGNTGTVLYGYGLYVTPPTYGSVKYSIYTPSGTTYLGGGAQFASVGHTNVTNLNYYEDYTWSTSWQGASTAALSFYISRVGSIVTVTLLTNTITSTSGASGNTLTTLNTLPSQFIPAYNVTGTTVAADGGLNSTYFTITTAGVIEVNKDINNTVFSGSTRGCLPWTITYCIA